MRGEILGKPAKHTKGNKGSKIFLDVSCCVYWWDCTTEPAVSEAGKWRLKTFFVSVKEYNFLISMSCELSF